MIKTLTLSPSCSKEEMKERAGEQVTEQDFDYLIQDDCNAFDSEGEPLFFFRKNKISSELCREAYHGLKGAATLTNNRGTAGGQIGEGSEKQKNIQISKTAVKTVKKDGTISKTNRANDVHSGIVGYFDRNARFPYCRQTAWFADNFNKFQQSYPYIKKINGLFEDACPAKYAAQKSYAEATHSGWMLGDTVFTTITVNKNFRTALHTDAGDCKEGLGNLSVLSAGQYEGGFTVIPRYRVAFDVRSGDVCFFNVHEYHANTEIKAKLAYERISIVCYYRENMRHCLDPKVELKRVANRVRGDKLN